MNIGMKAQTIKQDMFVDKDYFVYKYHYDNICVAYVEIVNCYIFA